MKVNKFRINDDLIDPEYLQNVLRKIGCLYNSLVLNRPPKKLHGTIFIYNAWRIYKKKERLRRAPLLSSLW